MSVIFLEKNVFLFDCHFCWSDPLSDSSGHIKPTLQIFLSGLKPLEKWEIKWMLSHFRIVVCFRESAFLSPSFACLQHSHAYNIYIIRMPTKCLQHDKMPTKCLPKMPTKNAYKMPTTFACLHHIYHSHAYNRQKRGGLFSCPRNWMSRVRIVPNSV
jgi:hypothetical protein